MHLCIYNGARPLYHSNSLQVLLWVLRFRQFNRSIFAILPYRVSFLEFLTIYLKKSNDCYFQLNQVQNRFASPLDYPSIGNARFGIL